LDLSTNIRQGWGDLPGRNALPYYEHSQNTAVKSFIKLCRIKKDEKVIFPFFVSPNDSDMK
jgi:hypothetical protein